MNPNGFGLLTSVHSRRSRRRMDDRQTVRSGGSAGRSVWLNWGLNERPQAFERRARRHDDRRTEHGDVRVILRSTSGIRRLQTSGLLTAEESLPADQLASGAVGVALRCLDSGGLVGLVEENADLRSLEERQQVGAMEGGTRSSAVRAASSFRSARYNTPSSRLRARPAASPPRARPGLDRDGRLLEAHREVAEVDQFGGGRRPQYARAFWRSASAAARCPPLANRRKGVDGARRSGASAIPAPGAARRVALRRA